MSKSNWLVGCPLHKIRLNMPDGLNIKGKFKYSYMKNRIIISVLRE